MVRLIGVGFVSALFLFGIIVSPEGSAANEGDNTTESITFTKDVAPILMKNCVSCHRPGEVAPMSLLTYKEVRPWARSIREVVAERRMPPWFADPKYGEFSNDCRLSEDEIKKIGSWVDGGSKEGDPKEMPKPPQFAEGWQMGKPDVVLTMLDEFVVPTEGAIPYKMFRVPTNFTEDKYVQFAEIRAGDRAHVHHIIVTAMNPGESGGFGGFEGELPPQESQPAAPREQRRGFGPARRPAEGAPRVEREPSDGRLVGWAPGEAPLICRDGDAKLVKKGAVLMFQVHYVTNGEPGRDRSSIGLIFSKKPVKKRVITAGAASMNLAIPPGDPNYRTTGSFVFRDDSHIDSLHPHMHLRGKDFEYKLTYPDGTSKILLSVPKWDFNWQLTYFFKEPVPAPKGSRLEVVAHFDNSEKNKFNPDPTKLVRFGPQTWDEMMIGYFDYTLDKQDLRTRRETASK